MRKLPEYAILFVIAAAISWFGLSAFDWIVRLIVRDELQKISQMQGAKTK